MKLLHKLTFWSALLVAAILINAFIFMVAPILSDISAHKQDNLALKPILLAPPPPPQEQKKRKALEKPNPNPKQSIKTPTLSMKQLAQNRPRPKLNIKAPAFETAMSNQISPAQEVVPPPPDASSDFAAASQTGIVGFEIGELDTPPIHQRQFPPAYPFMARRQGITGTVTVRFLVNAAGTVEKISIISSKPKGIFEQSVKNCISKWRFKPGIYEGQPVATWVVVPIAFKL